MGNKLDAESVICGACFGEYRHKGAAAVLAKGDDGHWTAEQYRLHLEAVATLPEGMVPLARHTALIAVLTELTKGRLVDVPDGVDIARRARSDLDLADIAEWTLKEETMRLFDDVLASAGDVCRVAISGGEVDGDHRRRYCVLVPSGLDSRCVGTLYLRERVLQRPHGDVTRASAPEVAGHIGDMDGGARLASQRESDEAIIQRSARLVRVSVLRCRGWANSPHSRPPEVDLQMRVPDSATYVQDSFPPELSMFLTSLCGMTLGPAGPAEDGGDGRYSKDATFISMVGTMIGRRILGPRFVPKHYLQVSQAFKSRGVGAQPIALFSTLNVCMSDKQRWMKENLVAAVGDDSLAPADRSIGVSAAFDNDGCDPTAKFSTASHCSFIGYTSHHHEQALSPPATFGSKSAWMPVADLTEILLLNGRPCVDHGHTMRSWNTLWLASIGKSRAYLQKSAQEVSCLEVELRKVLKPAPVPLVSQNLFVQSGYTKCEADSEAPLERIFRICHAVGEDGRVIMMEGDEETYIFLVNAAAANPRKWRHVIPHSGGWHVMLHVTRAFVCLLWGAGVESIAKLLGGDDKHSAAGKTHRRNHHFLMVTFEGMWIVVVEEYCAEKGCQSPDIEQAVVPWLQKRAETHTTLRFWLPFLLDYFPAYIAFRTATRTGDYRLRTATFRELAPILTVIGKVRYQRVFENHIGHVTRMTDGDFRAAGTRFCATHSGCRFSHVALDESQEMSNRIVKSTIGRITPGFVEKLGPISESRKAAMAAVGKQLHPSAKERDTAATLARDRGEAVPKVLPFVRSCSAFTHAGKDTLKSFSLAAAIKSEAQKMLALKDTASER